MLPGGEGGKNAGIKDQRLLSHHPGESRGPLQRFKCVPALAGMARRAETEMISGLSHITFITHDLEKMSRVLLEVLGGKEVYSSDAKQFSIAAEKFFMVGDVWVVIMQGEGLSARTYNHIAFKTDHEGLARARLAIEILGLEQRPPRPRIEGEGQSLYFYDYDNHLFELHTGTLGQRLQAYGKQ